MALSDMVYLITPVLLNQSSSVNIPVNVAHYYDGKDRFYGKKKKKKGNLIG